MKFVSNAKCGIPVEDGTVFNAKFKSVEISIHRIRDCDGWFLNCRMLGFVDRELDSDSLMTAIHESKEIIDKRIESIQNNMQALFQGPIEIARY